MRRIFLGIFLMICFSAGPGKAAFAAELEHAPGLYTGSQAPDFTAATHDGKSVTLSDLTKKGPVVLVFYRGAWCPYCNLHLRQFQENLAEIESYGASVLGVSVDLTEYAKKTVAGNGLEFPVVSDPNAELLTSYNLLFEVPEELAAKYKNEYGIDLEKHSGRDDHIIAVPATYVINRQGTIVFGYASKDYKVRTSPREVLQVLKSSSS